MLCALFSETQHSGLLQLTDSPHTRLEAGNYLQEVGHPRIQAWMAWCGSTLLLSISHQSPPDTLCACCVRPTCHQLPSCKIAMHPLHILHTYKHSWNTLLQNMLCVLQEVSIGCARRVGKNCVCVSWEFQWCTKLFLWKSTFQWSRHKYDIECVALSDSCERAAHFLLSVCALAFVHMTFKSACLLQISRLFPTWSPPIYP